MKRRDAIKVAALAALAVTTASAYDEKLIVNKQKMEIKDPANPTEDCEKITISKVSDNIYSVIHYYYYNNQWNQSDTEKFTLDGNNLLPVDEEDTEVSSIKLLVANSSQLVVEMKGRDEDGDFYNKMTYKRL